MRPNAILSHRTTLKTAYCVLHNQYCVLNRPATRITPQNPCSSVAPPYFPSLSPQPSPSPSAFQLCHAAGVVEIDDADS
jgi:hypothetical protein